MKIAEKEVVRAGLVTYHMAMVSKATMVLADMREQMHHIRSGKAQRWGILTDWEGFYGMARAQVMVLRRAKLTLEAVSLQRRVDETLMAVFDDPKEEERAREHGRLGEIERGLEKAGREQWAPFTPTADTPISDDTPVRWVSEAGPPGSGTMTTWGALNRQDRKTVELVNGEYVGGLPF